LNVVNLHSKAVQLAFYLPFRAESYRHFMPFSTKTQRKISDMTRCASEIRISRYEKNPEFTHNKKSASRNPRSVLRPQRTSPVTAPQRHTHNNKKNPPMGRINHNRIDKNRQQRQQHNPPVSDTPRRIHKQGEKNEKRHQALLGQNPNVGVVRSITIKFRPTRPKGHNRSRPCFKYVNPVAKPIGIVIVDEPPSPHDLEETFQSNQRRINRDERRYREENGVPSVL
jgi:hypothetical protein